MTETYPNNELGRLVGSMCDGTITADDAVQLDLLLTHNEDARRFYNNYMFLHAELYSQHAAVEVSQELRVESQVSEEAQTVLCSTASQATLRSRASSHGPKGKRYAWLAIAVGAGGCGGGEQLADIFSDTSRWAKVVRGCARYLRRCK